LRSYLLYCDPFRNGTSSESILRYGALFGDSELEHSSASSANETLGLARGCKDRRFSSESIMETTISVNQHPAVFI
jgi:hypothetical protein